MCVSVSCKNVAGVVTRLQTQKVSPHMSCLAGMKLPCKDRLYKRNISNTFDIKYKILQDIKDRQIRKGNKYIKQSEIERKEGRRGREGGKIRGKVHVCLLASVFVCEHLCACCLLI